MNSWREKADIDTISSSATLRTQVERVQRFPENLEFRLAKEVKSRVAEVTGRSRFHFVNNPSVEDTAFYLAIHPRANASFLEELEKSRQDSREIKPIFAGTKSREQVAGLL